LKTIKILAPAKINLYLKVLGKAKNGYHRIDTVFQALDLYDEVLVSASSGKPRIKIICKDPAGRVLKELSGRNNIVYRAAVILSRDRKIKCGARIEVKKRIPVEAGMGGGSSDAAAALAGLNEAWGLGITRKEMLVYAGELGSDVPFFLYGGTARGTGYGGAVKPLKPLKRWFVIVNPDFKVSTRRVYEMYDRVKGRARFKGGSGFFWKELGESMVNDLEQVVIEKYPVLNEIKKFLFENGASAAMMTGSGPTVFAAVKNREEGMRIKKKVSGYFNCSAWVARTCGRRKRAKVAG